MMRSRALPWLLIFGLAAAATASGLVQAAARAPRCMASRMPSASNFGLPPMTPSAKPGRRIVTPSRGVNSKSSSANSSMGRPRRTRSSICRAWSRVITLSMTYLFAVPNAISFAASPSNAHELTEAESQAMFERTVVERLDTTLQPFDETRRADAPNAPVTNEKIGPGLTDEQEAKETLGYFEAILSRESQESTPMPE